LQPLTNEFVCKTKLKLPKGGVVDVAGWGEGYYPYPERSDMSICQ